MSTQELVDDGIIPHDPITPLDYLKLVEKAAANGLAEDWVQARLAEHGMIVDRFDDEVIFTDESWKAITTVREAILEIEYAGKRVDKKGERVFEPLPAVETDIEDPIIAERKRLKKWAAEEGIAAPNIEMLWGASYLPPGQDPQATSNRLKITAKRLEKFKELIHGAIADLKDRAFAEKYYGVTFPADRLLAPLHLGPRRIEFEFSGQLRSIEIEGKTYEPLHLFDSGAVERDADNAGDSGAVADAEITEPEAEEQSEPAAIHREKADTDQADGKNFSNEEPAERLLEPTMRYQQAFIAQSTYTKEQYDWLFNDFAEGAELDHDLLDAFENYLENCIATGVKANLPAVVDAELIKEQQQFNRLAPTFENADYFVRSMMREVAALENVMSMFTQRLAEGVKDFEEYAHDGFDVIRQVSEPELPRYTKTTYKKDEEGKPTGEVAHRAGDMKSKTFKGFADADICYKKTGGVKLPKQFELDNWAKAQCQPIIEILEDAANEWLSKEAPEEIKAVCKIKIVPKVSKEAVKANLDNYNFPGIVHEPERETGKIFLARRGRGITFKPYIEQLEQVLNRVKAALSDEGENDEN